MFAEHMLDVLWQIEPLCPACATRSASMSDGSRMVTVTQKFPITLKSQIIEAFLSRGETASFVDEGHAAPATCT